MEYQFPQSILCWVMGKGGFWLGGQTALVHWHEGVSETYPIEALKSNAGQPGIAGLARAPDGALWVGILADGPGRGLGRLINGIFHPFVTHSFDGSKLAVHNLIFDHDGNLWVATSGNGIFRIRGDLVDHFGRADGLADDSPAALFEDREGILWAATPGEGIDKFRDPPIASFSTFEGLGNSLPQGVLGQQRRHNLGRKPWLSRSHREERDHFVHSHPRWSSG